METVIQNNPEILTFLLENPSFLDRERERREEHRIFVNLQRQSAVDRIINAAMEDPEESSIVTQKVKNFILTGPTQMGKTKYIIDSIKELMTTKSLIVISCDNRVDQMNQLKNRLRIEGITPWKLKSNIPDMATSLNRGNSVVIVMLNNSCQVKKLQSTVGDLKLRADFDHYRVFHDEGDMVNKSDEINDISNRKYPESHRRWVLHFNSCRVNFKNVTRYWISATPENCAMLYDIPAKNIIVFPKDEKYVGITKHVEWDNSSDDFKKEITRLRQRNTGEVILYCTSRKNEEQENLAKGFSLDYPIISCVYNGKGISTFIEGRKEIFENKDIASFLSEIRETSIDENLPVVVFGFELMNRGISFVSMENSPLTATTMFYKGGESYLVNLAQRFGRITGTSRPDLKDRRLYCSTKDYEDYIIYSNNQKNVWDALSLQENSDKNIGEIMKTVEVIKTNRKLDRPKLGSVNSEYLNCTKREVPRDINLDKMKRLVNSWKNENNDTVVARLFRAMVANGGWMENSRVRSYVGEGPAHTMVHHHHSNWDSVFLEQDSLYKIKTKALEYYNSL